MRGFPKGYLARGAGSTSVVVLHEAYGLRGAKSNVPDVCDRLAAAGFSALAPDLYDGAAADTVEEALALAATLRPEASRQAIEAAVAHLRAEPGMRGVALLGFCMGGGLAFRSALEVAGVSAAVVFYGTPRGDFGRLSVPVLAHFALDDRFVSLDAVRAAEARLLALGKSVTFHYYDAEHGFMNERLPAHAAAAAALAWARTLAFLRGLAPAEAPAAPAR
jgi:carboxymethylenebutenolidase